MDRSHADKRTQAFLQLSDIAERDNGKEVITKHTQLMNNNSNNFI